MMKERNFPKSMVFILIVSLFFVTACAGGIGGDNRDTAGVKYHTGTQGLFMRFLPGSPPPRIYETDPLNIIVEYANKGATDITNGRLYVSGYDTNYVHLNPPYMTGVVAEGKSVINPLGEITNVAEFTDTQVGMPRNTDVFPQTFKVTACYAYQTQAAPVVCIDPDPLRVQPENKVCTPHNVGLESQGAPVAITSIEQSSARDKVLFKIHIANVGGGTVLSSQGGNVAIDNCHSALTRDQINKVEITSAALSGRLLDCHPKIVRLINGANGVAFCSLSGVGMAGSQDAYETTLNIELSYGYRNSIMGRTEILRLPETNDFLRGNRYP
jgi:hypothetical protein